MNLYSKQPLAPPQRQILAAYRTLNHRLAHEMGWWSTIPIYIDTRLCHFCSYNEVENGAHFVLECPLYKPMRVKFPTLFENVVLGSLKPFFQLGQQVDICLNLIETSVLRHSGNLMTYFLVPLDFSASWTLKSISFHYKMSPHMVFPPIPHVCGTQGYPSNLSIFWPHRVHGILHKGIAIVHS